MCCFRVLEDHSNRVEVQDGGGEGHLSEEVGDLPCHAEAQFVEAVAAVALEGQADVGDREETGTDHEAHAEEPVQRPELDAERHGKPEHGGQRHEVDADRHEVFAEFQFDGEQCEDQDGQCEKDGGPAVEAELIAVDGAAEGHTVEAVAKDEGEDAQRIGGGLLVRELFEDGGVLQVRVGRGAGAVGVAEEQIAEPAVGQRRDDELHDTVRKAASREFQEGVRSGGQFTRVRPGKGHVDAVPDEHCEGDAVRKEYRRTDQFQEKAFPGPFRPAEADVDRQRHQFEHPEGDDQKSHEMFLPNSKFPQDIVPCKETSRNALRKVCGVTEN